MQPNADRAEVRKFDALAHRFWDPRGDFAPLHALNPVRVRFVEERCALPGRHVLDVGCGGGLLAEALVGRGAQVAGIDLADGMIEVARLHAHESGIAVDYRVASVELMATEAPGAFDVVTCMEMLEHVPDPAATFASFARLLRPGGDLFVSTINRNLKSFALAIVAAEYVLGLVPKGTHEYERLIRPAELGRWARAEGFELRALKGLEFDPFTRSCRMTDDTSVNYIAHLALGGAAAPR
jgi:2-polyprenyl-6-hydroxyphenyl methylase/3-demethylubiquinone-9 3-methyltransferase